MMRANGVLFLGKTGPLAIPAADGTFVLTLLAFDRIGTHQVEPWRITWGGEQAHRFYDENRSLLRAGQPIEVELECIRTFTVGRYGAAESHAKACSIKLAPFSHEVGRQPLSVNQSQLSKAEQFLPT